MLSPDSPIVPVLLLDGGLGTTLEEAPYNTEFSPSTPLWSSHLLISSPQTLLEVQQSFVKAGVDILLTATYNASFEGFAATSRQDTLTEADNRKTLELQQDGYGRVEAATLMRNAVSIAKSAFTSEATVKPDNGLVALSLGAYGATMTPSQEYSGSYQPTSMLSVSGLQVWHKERLSIFREHVDTWKTIEFVAFETLPLRAEICAVRRVMTEANDASVKKRWWISCVFPNENLKLPDGSSVAEVVDAMLTDQIDGEKTQVPWGIGINCTKVRKLRDLVTELEDGIERLVKKGKVEAEWPWLVIYPDGAEGLVYNSSTRTWEAKPDEIPIGVEKGWDEQVFNIAMEIRRRARWKGILVGGCCKTTPGDISKLRTRIDKDLGTAL